MDAHVLVEIALLRECLAAAEHRAREGFLLGVRTQVVEQIVPLLESLWALAVLADERLSPTLTFFFEVLYVLEGPEAWNWQVLVEGGNVDFCTFFKHHPGPSLNTKLKHEGFFDCDLVEANYLLQR